MTDNEIIKAFECCSSRNTCWECPMVKLDICSDGLSKISNSIVSDIFDLINRQQAEIEELKKENKDLAKRLSDADSVKLTVEYWEQSIKSEATKEFAERLCDGRVSNDPVVIAVKVELERMKEMTGVEE